MNVFASFVIPALNEERNIERCLISIRNLDLQGLEIEIVMLDNGSRDRTVEIARRYANIVEVHPGRSVAWLRNRGSQLAKGQHLAFVDADCELPADWLVKCRDASVKAGPQAAVGNFYSLPKGASWVQLAWLSTKPQQEGEAAFLPAGNFFISHALFESLGGFNEALISGEDYDLFLRLRRSGGRVILDPTIVSLHHEKRPTLRGTVRKEYWYGKGMAETFRQGAISKPMLLAIANALSVAIGIVVALFLHRYAFAFLLFFAVPTFCAFYSCARAKNFRYFIHLIPIYTAYLAGRFGSIIWLLRRRFAF